MPKSSKSTPSKPKTTPDKSKMRDRHLAEFKQELAMQKFQEERPQLWLQYQRLSRLVDIQGQLEGDSFPEGSCFLHGNFAACSTFVVKRIIGIDLDVCQVTIEVHGDDNLEEGVVILPIEMLEWFGFPAKAVPVGIHFEGFAGHLTKLKEDGPVAHANLIDVKNSEHKPTR